MDLVVFSSLYCFYYGGKTNIKIRCVLVTSTPVNLVTVISCTFQLFQIATLSPSDQDYEQTMSTLRYGNCILPPLSHVSVIKYSYIATGYALFSSVTQIAYHVWVCSIELSHIISLLTVSVCNKHPNH